MANPIDVPSSPCSQKIADDLEQPLLLPLRRHSQSTSNCVTFLRTCFNSTNALSGIGVLSMPYALSQGGWLSLALFFVVVVICFYTGLLVQRCMDADRCIKTYPEVGQLAFGYKGRIAIAILMYLELYLVGVSLLILEGDNMDKMFPDTCVEFGSVSIKGKQLFVILSSLVILPTTWSRNMTVIAYFSVIGVLASVLLLGSLLWTGIADTGFHWKGRALNMSGLPTTLGLYFVCFTSHAVFPTIYASMEERTRFPKVLVISFVLCTFNYGLVAVLGYLMYGDEVESQVTLNLHAEKPLFQDSNLCYFSDAIREICINDHPCCNGYRRQVDILWYIPCPPRQDSLVDQYDGYCIDSSIFWLRYDIHRIISVYHHFSLVSVYMLPKD
ncbi:vacuolar amino acid transporter 1-like isoform X2 [Iris pallida]|uniref:Vacuolar amino acid transporter 1-like isoform X2 n=1 Tax=Iris pallida TaxID=29817 RepID=A0AAX6HMB6_IRIPA|nr:vacuolar amino acid transporter 1-like isoform X2 [Iris pallida]